VRNLGVFLYSNGGEEMFKIDKKHFKGTKKLFTVAGISIFLATLFQLLNPLIIKVVVDYNLTQEFIDNNLLREFSERIFINGELLRNLVVSGLIIILFSVTRGYFSYLNGRVSALGSEKIAKNLKDSLYTHIQDQNYLFHVNSKTGDLIQRSTSDVETLRKFFNNQMMEIVRAVFILGIVVAIMISLNAKMTIYALSLMPIIVGFSYFYFERIKKYFTFVDESEAEMSTVIQENLSGIKVVRAFNRKQFEVDKFEVKNKKFSDNLYVLIKNLGYYWGLSDMLCFSQILITIVVGMKFTLEGQMTVGTYIAFINYGTMTVWPVRMMGRLLTDLGKSKVAAGRINEILDIEPESFSNVMPEIKGVIKIRGLEFSYEDHDVLKGIDFDIKPGEKIGIVGPTGSGKTTLANLLVGMYPADKGSITVDGHPIDGIDKKYLRRKISLIMQNTFLFAKTIEENIKIADNNISKERIVNAAKISSIHDTIMNFDKGYDTIVGERGVSLSGGQKQRISIARKLLEDAKILIFDDSLSAVDTETESKIKSSLNEVRENIGIILISHRITSVIDSDRIYVLEDGVITGVGNHLELLARNKFYKEIYTKQFEEGKVAKNIV
jgi:ATP-binding cassette subfamily B protein